MPKNGKSAVAGGQMVRRTLDKPEQVGTISVAEAAEIRERNRLIEKYTQDLKDKQDAVNDAAKLVALLRMESGNFLQTLCRDRGLDLADTYNVESESGLIWRTATIEQVAPEPPPAADENAPELVTSAKE